MKDSMKYMSTTRSLKLRARFVRGAPGGGRGAGGGRAGGAHGLAGPRAVAGAAGGGRGVAAGGAGGGGGFRRSCWTRRVGGGAASTGSRRPRGAHRALGG